MKKYKKILSFVLSFVMIFSSLVFTVAGEEVERSSAIKKDSSLKVEGEIDLGEWNFSAFGSNTSETKNPVPIIQDDGSITLKATGGKIASGDEGMSFYYKELPATANFELYTKATVHSFNNDSGISTPNQKSFGLMLKEKIGENGTTSKSTSKYVAVGALDQVMKPFYKIYDSETEGITQIKGNAFDTTVPAADEIYDLSIKKSGNTYVLTCNGEAETKTVENVFSGGIFAGLYVARDAEIRFSDFDIKVDSRKVSELKVSNDEGGTEYLQHEELDITGLKVIAMYSDGTEEVLSEEDYIITGFDSSHPGVNTITIHYNGVTANLDLIIKELTCTSLEIKYLPSKIEYYVGDAFDPQGFSIIGIYNDGYLTKELAEQDYCFYFDDQEITEGYIFNTPGTQTITVKSVETPETVTQFTIEVKDTVLEKLEIRKQPIKDIYFIGDDFDPTGMIVYAKYADGTDVRLLANEYTLSTFDSDIAGEKTVTITYKNKTVDVVVTVKEKEVIGLEVIRYPKTTYVVGEELNLDGLEISKVYDNEEREKLDIDQYHIDDSTYDKDVIGIYDIQIKSKDENIKSTSFSVTVREAVEREWKTIVFGQSIKSSTNYVEEKEDAIQLVALEGGGKVTGDHDGITFYYVELDADEDNFILSADITVKEYAKTPHDGQESFGMMARDAIGTHLDASVFASNIAAIGGYSGGTRDSNGTQLFVRTGVESSDGAGSQGIQKIMLKEERPTAANTARDYRLTLAKTNSGFTGKINDEEEKILYAPDILKVQDSKMYVGFYTARLAAIEVRNIELKVTSTKTDAPKVEPPIQPVEPNFEFVSLGTSSQTDYNLMIQGNVDGIVTIKKDNEVIAREQQVKAGTMVMISTTINNQGNTNFSGIFLPDDEAYLTSYDKIVKNFTVEMKSFRENEDIYVSPNGTRTGEGTKENPLDLDTAITFVKPGQKIIMLEGTYHRNEILHIMKYNDGTEEKKKHLWSDEGAKVIIDFNKKSEGGLLSGDYWHIKGIDFTNSAGNTKGFTVGGNHNRIELCNFYNNGDTGLQISRTDFATTIAQWPSYNLILNCTSFDNKDPSENNADGFGAKLTVGVGNVFDGCIAHNNIDDGWDLYTKAGSGPIGPVTIKNCITYDNGRLTNGTVGKGDKNGFKLGGEGIHVPHKIENCISFHNGAYGFTSNSNPGIIAKDNIAFNNAGGNLNFTTYGQIPTDFTLDGFISYQNKYDKKDNYPSALQSDKNFLFNGKVSQNKAGFLLTDENFVSLDVESAIPYKRDGEGKIIQGDLLKFIPPQNYQDTDSDQNQDTEQDTSQEQDKGKNEKDTKKDQDKEIETKTPENVVESATGVKLNKDIVGYVSGYPDGTFKPDQSITREEALSLIYQLVINEDKDEIHMAESPFYDLDVHSWSAKAVLYFYNKALIQGYTDGTFKPGHSMTRAEFICIMAHFIPKDVYGGLDFTFTDLQGHWARVLIEKAAAAGWVMGYTDGTFRPDQPLTRAEVITIMNRVLDKKIDTNDGDLAMIYKDVPQDHWAYQQIVKASK